MAVPAEGQSFLALHPPPGRCRQVYVFAEALKNPCRVASVPVRLDVIYPSSWYWGGHTLSSAAERTLH
eukprot:16437110-Heterocapsa_arctica.AAC.1